MILRGGTPRPDLLLCWAGRDVGYVKGWLFSIVSTTIAQQKHLFICFAFFFERADIINYLTIYIYH